MAVSLVLFDLGDVIARWDPSPRLDEYAARAGASPIEIRERLAASMYSEQSDRGAFSVVEMEDRLSEVIGCHIAHDEFLRLEAMAFKVRPEVVAIAEATSRHVPVGILANNSPLCQEALSRHFPELVQVFRPILFSFQFGHAKPEREIFNAVQLHLRLDPREILLVDDKASNVAAARSADWDAVQYQSETGLRRDLAKRGVIAGAV
jgi:HAD superfamily hydrolase (TIGR01509 family)